MQKSLTENDKKEIKQLTKIGFVLPIFILLISGIVNLYFVLGEDVKFNILSLTLIDFGILAFCIVISYLMNRKYYKDLKSGITNIRIEKVIYKEDKTSYEAGSGNLHKPFLGTLFPKIWGQKMKPNHLVYLIINNYRYEVSKTLYDNIKIGELVEMHYSSFSDTLLTIEKSRKNASG